MTTSVTPKPTTSVTLGMRNPKIYDKCNPTYDWKNIICIISKDVAKSEEGINPLAWWGIFRMSSLGTVKAGNFGHFERFSLKELVIE